MRYRDGPRRLPRRLGGAPRRAPGSPTRPFRGHSGSSTRYTSAAVIFYSCLLYTSDAADDTPCVDL
eukprot:1646041-Pyramimonas_sp.AAC.1